MKMGLAAASGVLAVCCTVLAQAQTGKTRAAIADHDQLGLTCAQILATSSSDWVTEFEQKAAGEGSSQDKTLRAIGVYGKCYEARTDRLAAALGRKGAAPLMGARGSFRDFEQALDAFTAKGLAANDPPADDVKAAYAALYRKQFRYEYYKAASKGGLQAGVAKPSGGAAARAHAPKAPAASKGAAPAALESGGPQNPAGVAADDGDAMTAAKNHFGELLDELPEAKMHELHAAFGDIVSRGEMSEATRLAAYRYAIFVLEPVTSQPFSGPPF